MSKNVTITIDETQGAVWVDSGVKIDISDITHPICDCKADIVGLFACKYIADLMQLSYDELSEMRLRQIQENGRMI